MVVIGAGFSGLSAACHLLGRGHDVTVVEQAPGPGGLAGRWQSAGYTVDNGPTVLTMPALLEAAFAAAGADLADHVRLRPLDPLYRATFPDSDPIAVRREPAAMEQEIRDRCGPADAASYRRFCDWLAQLNRIELPHFIDRNYDSPLDLVRPLGPAVRLARLGGLRSMAAVVEERFADPRLRQLFSFQALYAGLSPYDARAVFCIITYMDTVGGVWFPDGGIHAVAAGLAAAAGKGGAAMRFGAGAARIVRRLGRSGPVTGVRLVNGQTVPADVAVLTADPAVAYPTLLPELDLPRAVRRGEYSPSCTLWLAGVEGALPAGTAHHNVHFGGVWRGAFDALLRRGVRPPDPSILVSAPTVTDATLAPADGHVLYALEPAPNLDGRVDWRYERERARSSLVARLAALGYPVGAVVTSQFTDPAGWEERGLARGTPFSLSHRFFQSGPWRPANLDRRVPGLVLAGAATVPGVGIPMALISGRLAAARVDQLAAGRA